ncbi:hypothetical protein H5410_012587 [Solanum commersonii]|uniref:Uncharacterized protein n=1 Tax=Solanum commersonii TaxID=4109 RepID=A0A9J6AST4_SOLCO|nr:hypothetical protein H5410_012587 [Solanum commersonii]
MEYTNQMYGLLNVEEMPNSMHPEDFNDHCYVINKNLKLIDDAIEAKTHEEGSTSNAPQPTAGPMDSVGTNFDMSWSPLLALVDAPVLSEIPLLVPSTVPSGTNFERPMLPLTAPLMGPSSAPTQMPQFMFPLRTPPQMVPFVDILQVPSSSSSQSALVPMEYNVNGSFGIPQSPSFSELLSLNDDEIMTLLDDTSFDINVPDPNHHHHNNL